jgi:hypothetical protein
MRRRRVGFMVVAATAVLTAPLDAQRRPPVQHQVRTAETVLLVGGSRLDIGELNARFDAFGYPTFGDRFVQFGFARWTGRDRLQFGGDVVGLFRPALTTADNRYQTRLGGGYGMLNLGYDAYRHGGLSVRPNVGLGAGAVMLTITDQAAPPFDEVLAHPGRDVQVGSGSLLFDGSLGVTYRVQPRGMHSLVLGARAGWTQSLLHGEWSREQGVAAGGPTAGWGGPHFDFVIGRSTRR